MNKKNFNSISQFSVPQNWIDDALSIPSDRDKKKPIPFVKFSRTFAAVACLVLVCCVSLLLFFMTDDGAKPPVKETQNTSFSDVVTEETSDLVSLQNSDNTEESTSSIDSSNIEPTEENYGDNSSQGIKPSVKPTTKPVVGPTVKPTGDSTIEPSEKPVIKPTEDTEDKPVIPTTRPPMKPNDPQPSEDESSEDSSYEDPEIPTSKPINPQPSVDVPSEDPSSEDPQIPTDVNVSFSVDKLGGKFEIYCKILDSRGNLIGDTDLYSREHNASMNISNGMIYAKYPIYYNLITKSDYYTFVFYNSANPKIETLMVFLNPIN
ncbi:MAG: hypothetical protein IJ015_02825 [Ruminococcus sp.]|nr:hypothetical protein [Ruminococcus sp.]